METEITKFLRTLLPHAIEPTLFAVMLTGAYCIGAVIKDVSTKSGFNDKAAAYAGMLTFGLYAVAGTKCFFKPQNVANVNDNTHHPR